MANMMKYISQAQLAVLLLSTSACAGFGTAPVSIGEPEAAIIAKLGKPSHRYPDGNTLLLEYAHGPWGQQTYMARFDSAGKLIAYEQVLTSQKFATITVGTSNKTDVLHTIGAPSETSFLALPQLEVWSYPYKENGVWDSMMHVHFDKQGIVQKMMNGPDPNRDPDMRWPFGRRRH